jgi:hypothetical protein
MNRWLSPQRKTAPKTKWRRGKSKYTGSPFRCACNTARIAETRRCKPLQKSSYRLAPLSQLKRALVARFDRSPDTSNKWAHPRASPSKTTGSRSRSQRNEFCFYHKSEKRDKTRNRISHQYSLSHLVNETSRRSLKVTLLLPFPTSDHQSPSSRSTKSFSRTPRRPKNLQPPPKSSHVS